MYALRRFRVSLPPSIGRCYLLVVALTAVGVRGCAAGGRPGRGQEGEDNHVRAFAHLCLDGQQRSQGGGAPFCCLFAQYQYYSIYLPLTDRPSSFYMIWFERRRHARDSGIIRSTRHTVDLRFSLCRTNVQARPKA